MQLDLDSQLEPQAAANLHPADPVALHAAATLTPLLTGKDGPGRLHSCLQQQASP
jgi:hypothetical protein